MKDYIKMEIAGEQIFEMGNTLYLSDVIARVKTEFEGNQRRDTLSAFNTLVKRASANLETTPANATSLRPVLTELNAVKLGVSPKRLANIRSLITQAVAHFGMQRRWIGNDIELAENWRVLLESVPKREYNWSLRRLACYCTVKGIAPADVSPQTLLGLYAALEADCVISKPRSILKATISVWNMCLKVVPDWPQHKLASPFKTAAFMFPLTDFPQSFQDDVAAWIKRNTDVDPLDLNGPVRPLRPVTLNGYVLTFRRLGSALVHNKKLPMTAMTDLSVLADIDNLKDALRHFVSTVKSDTTNYPHKMANQMAAVARPILSCLKRHSNRSR